EVAIICTLLTEYDAVCLILDEVWDKNYKRNERDKSIYTTGRVGRHNVVVALLPHTTRLTAISTIEQLDFLDSQLGLFLLVGICGGIPNIDDSELMLGDVVISSRVDEYDFGRNLNRNAASPSKNYQVVKGKVKDVLYEVSQSKSSEMMLELEMRRFLFELQRKDIASGEILAEPKYNYPEALKDRLFSARYTHKHRITDNDCSVCNGNPDAICENVLHCMECNEWPDAVCDDARKASCQEIGCDEGQLLVRNNLRGAHTPNIYFGNIASGDIAAMNGLERDRISEWQNVIAFDMNRFDGWEKLPCIFIKGICDYADGHKDDGWQNFAAATAAAATKALLGGY
ncbi:hypothetical protein CI102_13255, partial [Trichoderma harzianum]